MTVYKLLDLCRSFQTFKKSYCEAASVKYYYENLGQFLRWLSNVNGLYFDDLTTELLTRENYINYLIHLRQLNIKNVSVNTYIRAVKVFCRWCYDEGYIEEDITQRVKYPRDDPDFIYPLTIEEGIRLDECFDTDTYIGLRNYCIVHLMLDCGFRSGEVVDLKLEHIRPGYVLIFDGKFNKSRHVPLPEWLNSALCRLTDSGPNLQYVFLDRYQKNQITDNPIKQLYILWRRNGDAAYSLRA